MKNNFANQNQVKKKIENLDVFDSFRPLWRTVLSAYLIRYRDGRFQHN